MSKKGLSRYSRYLSREEKKSISCSNAGKLGSAIRWANHVKIPTTQIRINTNDRDYLSTLAARSRVSVGCVVARLCDCLRSGEISLPSPSDLH